MDQPKPWPGRINDRLKHPAVVAGALALGLRMGQEASRLKKGEIDLEQFRRNAAKHTGTVGGTLTGAALGAIAGSWLPGAGTILGAFAGAFLGEMVGEQVGAIGAEKLERLYEHTRKRTPPG